MFSCGEKTLDRYLRQHSHRSTQAGYGRTYVAIEPGSSRVWGYYSITSQSVAIDLFPSAAGAPNSIPVVLIGRMAIQTELRGQGLGQQLMVHAFKMSLEAAERIGLHAIVVDALNETVKEKVYNRWGFLPLADDPLHLYLPLATLRDGKDTPSPEPP